MQSKLAQDSEDSLAKLFEAIRKLDPRSSTRGSSALGSSTGARSTIGSINPKSGTVVWTASEATTRLNSTDLCSLYGEIIEQVEPEKAIQHLKDITELLP